MYPNILKVQMNIRKSFSVLCAGICLALQAAGQVKINGGVTTIDGKVELDRTVCDFGDVVTGSGALTCTFTIRNISSKPSAIYNVVSSCGCTGVKWTRSPIAPNGIGTVTATYSNEEAPGPFDKSLTVYVADLRKPIILKLRGVSHARKVSPEEAYPIAFGPIRLRKTEMKAGNLVQGGQRSDSQRIINTSDKPAEVGFTKVSDGLSLSVHPNPVPAGQTATLRYTVTADRLRWGRNIYSASMTVNGKPYGRQLVFTAFTIEDFSSVTPAQKASAANPVFDDSTISLGLLPQGTVRKASWQFSNKGKTPLRIYKADCDSPYVTVSVVSDTPAGGHNTVNAAIDTARMPKGEFTVIITLTTDTPLRPLINLFLAGAVE